MGVDEPIYRLFRINFDRSSLSDVFFTDDEIYWQLPKMTNPTQNRAVPRHNLGVHNDAQLNEG